MATRSAYQAVALAQAVMADAGQPIDVDGKWGSFTQATYDRSTPAVRQKVDLVLQAFNLSASSLIAARAKEKASAKIALASSPGGAEGSQLSADRIRGIITAVARQEGVPPELALKVARLESNFNPMAKSPTGARGLFQLTGIALLDIKQRTGYVPSRSLFDPEENAILGMKYLKLVARYMQIPLSDYAKVYMGFNIGPSGAKAVLSGRPFDAAKQIALQSYGKQGPALYATNVEKAVAAA